MCGIAGIVHLDGETASPVHARAMADANPRAIVEGNSIPVRPGASLPQKRKKWIFF